MRTLFRAALPVVAARRNEAATCTRKSHSAAQHARLLRTAGVEALVIGIANSIDLTERALPQLRHRGATPTLVCFPAYSTNQVTAILKQRLAQLPCKVRGSVASCVASCALPGVSAGVQNCRQLVASLLRFCIVFSASCTPPAAPLLRRARVPARKTAGNLLHLYRAHVLLPSGPLHRLASMHHSLLLNIQS